MLRSAQEVYFCGFPRLFSVFGYWCASGHGVKDSCQTSEALMSAQELEQQSYAVKKVPAQVLHRISADPALSALQSLGTLTKSQSGGGPDRELAALDWY